MSDAPKIEVAPEDQSASKPPPRSKLPIILSILVPLILVGGGGAAAYFMGLIHFGHQKKHEPALKAKTKDAHKDKEGSDLEEPDEPAVAPDKVVFYSVPELLVNLSRQGKKTSFLRMIVKFELGSPEDVKVLDALKPRIIDQFQMHIRQLRVEDLEGAAGLQRLREELLKRARTVGAPAKIKDVLFEVLLVQ